ncbi:phosphotransferase [Xanthomonas citri pv. punicae]|nr:phosphotransferase [Xanthomonas citri pv. glycines str. 8ra]KAB0531739.1 phosphotransferase [Xanthomonas cissicola]MBE0316872.1 phosphotransferase [Xanthomonas citri pv. punicae]NMI15582.1 phosphotransferase [Xanthomonas citri]QDR47316.1 phosphotransferase [Xanthomonas citri pv. glycines]QGL19298.1 phosphotransferase [Xanthomonas citri pv. malvacearum]QTK37107.1 RNA 2'-phosphotransferase [Xanthomonas citri pv. glycines CFBP 2526]
MGRRRRFRQRSLEANNRQSAASVGQRYGEPVVLRVDAGRMHRNGLPFFKADNGVWLTAQVPAAFLTRPR